MTTEQTEIVKSQCAFLDIPEVHHAEILRIVQDRMKSAAEQAYKLGRVDQSRGNRVPNIVEHLKDHEII